MCHLFCYNNDRSTKGDPSMGSNIIIVVNTNIYINVYQINKYIHII